MSQAKARLVNGDVVVYWDHEPYRSEKPRSPGRELVGSMQADHSDSDLLNDFTIHGGRFRLKYQSDVWESSPDQVQIHLEQNVPASFRDQVSRTRIKVER